MTKISKTLKSEQPMDQRKEYWSDRGDVFRALCLVRHHVINHFPCKPTRCYMVDIKERVTSQGRDRFQWLRVTFDK